MDKDTFYITSIEIPALDYDWYQNHLGTSVAGMDAGEMKEIQEVHMQNKTYVVLWFVNATKLNTSYIMATLHTEEDDTIRITDLRHFEDMPNKVEFKNCAVFVTRKDEKI